MHPRILAILSVLGGTVAGAAVILAIQSLSPYIPPEGVTMEKTRLYNDWVRQLPTNAYLLVLFSYLVGAFAGGFTTHLISKNTKYRFALITGFALVIFGVGNFLNFTHPEWLTYSSCIGFMAFAWLGGSIIKPYSIKSSKQISTL